MITNLLRVLPALALSVLPLAGPVSASSSRPVPGAAALSAAPMPTPPSGDGCAAVPGAHLVEEAPEGPRDGYSRAQFKHWNKGLNPTDGCDTRKEVILAEALEAPAIGPKCALTGGRWWSQYDQVWITSASSLDVDHMVPLAEAWDSGAAA
ncbi:hypothetical protein [Streptomyces sp. NPDC005046]